jgi:hypothetical protein
MSRVLLGVLGITIAVGVFTYARRLSSSEARDVAADTEAATAQTAGVVPTPTDGAATPAPSNPSQPQQAKPQPSGPFRTETPGFVSQMPGATPTPTAPTQTAIANAAPAGDPKAAAPAADASRISIKPYQAPATSGPVSAGGGEAIGQGRAKVQAGKLLEARDVVNAAFVSGRLSAGDADAARALLMEINQTVVFSNRKFADDRFGGTYQVQPGDRLDRIGARHALTADLLLKINGMTDARKLRSGAYIKVLKGPFHAVVSKSAFRLDLYLGGLPGGGGDVVYVASFPVGLGKDDSTPLGKWQVEADRKVKNPVYYSPRGEGVIESDDPKNPLGEFWIGLVGIDGGAVGQESYGIHGTIEPDSIGKMESMGCIRLRHDDIALVFAALVETKSTVLVVE